MQAYWRFFGEYTEAVAGYKKNWNKKDDFFHEKNPNFLLYFY